VKQTQIDYYRKEAEEINDLLSEGKGADLPDDELKQRFRRGLTFINSLLHYVDDTKLRP
jgi:hypothetical protein